ncbi:hypothetical protein Daesc_001013 [Daldinia eschscholtzii]|uniref:RNA polymerase III subunit Rpc25 domain-containing protein n=1 Tax=Daldinia eschscholtzii TaxID=292717 RepID=A0AAX6N002_9PEZI
MYDLLWASEGLIGHGSGMVNVNGSVKLRKTEFTVPPDFTFLTCGSPLSSNHNENAWTWIYDPEGDPMWYDKNEMVRLQVIEEEWHDQTPESAEQEAVDKAKKLSPYRIKGTMMKEGLGVCLWWE